MAIRDHTVLTFDVVGTCIDFESGIVEAVERITGGTGSVPGRSVLLEAFARAEAHQQRRAAHLPFTQMLEPIYRAMARELGLPVETDQVGALRASIPSWPAFPDATDALGRLARRFRLVALTNADNWALGQMSAVLGHPFEDTVTAEDVG